MYYRVEEDPAILSRASAVGGPGFSPSYVFIGTWSQIAEYGGTNTSPVSLLFLWHLLSVTHFIAFYCTRCVHIGVRDGGLPPVTAVNGNNSVTTPPPPTESGAENVGYYPPPTEYGSLKNVCYYPPPPPNSFGQNSVCPPNGCWPVRLCVYM